MQTAIMVALAVLAFFGATIAVFIGGNWLLARFRKRQQPPNEAIQRYRRRLLNPRWDELQEHVGQTVPDPLRKLYKQTALISRQDLVFRERTGKEWHVAEFYPLDKETLNGIWPDLKKSKIFPFAFDSVGVCFYVEFARKDSKRCPVMYYHHDGGDVELVSESLDEFLKWNRDS